jgi:hypothetical protein
MAGKGLNIGRKKSAEWLKQRDNKALRTFGNILTPIQWYKSRRKGGGNKHKKNKVVEEVETLQLLLIQNQIREENKKRNSRAVGISPLLPPLSYPTFLSCRVRHPHFDEHSNEHFSWKKVE